MTAGTATGGGNTIQTDKVGFFDALYAKRVLDVLGVKMLSGLANNVDLTGLATGVVSSWGTEIEELASGAPTTASRPMTPHRLGSFIPMSNQLLIQNPQLEAFVIQSLMESIYVAVEAAYINGSGSAMTGLLGTANIQNVAIGTNGGAPSYAKILELVQTLGTANARVEDLKFLINPKVEAKLKQTAIDSGSGAMIMAYQNYFNGQPGVIDGKITAITSNVPSNLTKGSTTGVCSAIICGEFGKSAIGQFGGMDVIIDPYTLARTGQTRIVANTFWDCAFEQPAVFGAILDATTT
jgi:HK97 family phage major capsid protein